MSSSTPLLPRAAVRAKKAAAWSQTIAETEPTVMVTLGTNRAVSEADLMGHVSYALRCLDCERNRRPTNAEKCTKYPEKLEPRRRVHAFIAPEKIGLNSHVHLAVWHPFLLGCPRDNEFARKIARTRDEIDFLGLGRDEYVCDKDYRGRIPRLDTIWNQVCPSGHYHARRFDPATVAQGASYIAKEIKWSEDKDIYFSGEFWSERRRTSDSKIRYTRTVQ